jgi:hypothetical protein
MKTRNLILLAISLSLCAVALATRVPVVSAAEAAAPDADDLIAQTKLALEPTRRSVRDIEMVVRGADGSEVRWTARQARREVDGGQGIVTALLDPPSVHGFALLARKGKDGSDRLWMYVPPVRRVRELVGVDRFQPFLGSEFSLGELASFDVTDRSYEHAGEEQIDGVKAYKIVERLSEPTPYSRIETWISADRHLPLVRRYYDRAGDLWKVAHFQDVALIDDVPTVLHVTMKDEQAGGESELRISEVRYDADVPAGVFEPAALARAAELLK